MKLITIAFIKSLLLVTLMNCLFSFHSHANDSFSVYLVRHAEKQLDVKNPPLTQCGQQRAEQLALMLEKANITHIYSTQYTRTEQTAAPLAKQLNLTVKSYSPSDLETFAAKIKQAKKTSLIVGHSNTTPELTALIANTSVESITEQEYQMLYQVTFTGEQAQLAILKQPLTCQ